MDDEEYRIIDDEEQEKASPHVKCEMFVIRLGNNEYKKDSYDKQQILIRKYAAYLRSKGRHDE